MFYHGHKVEDNHKNQRPTTQHQFYQPTPRRTHKKLPPKIQRAFTSFRLRDMDRAIFGAAWLPAPSIRGLDKITGWDIFVSKPIFFPSDIQADGLFFDQPAEKKKNEHEGNFEG